MPLPYSLDLERLSAAYKPHHLTPTTVVHDVLDAINASQHTNPAWLHVVRGSNAKLSVMYAKLEDTRLPVAAREMKQFLVGAQLQY